MALIKRILIFSFVLLLAFAGFVFAHPEVSGELELELLTKGINEPVPAVIVLNKTIEPHELRVLKAIGVEIDETFYGDVIFGSLSWKMLEKLKDKDYLSAIGPDFEINALTDGATEIGFSKLLELNISKEESFGKNITVAVLDSGINNNNNLNLIQEIDFTGEGVADFFGHGTFVAETIGSNTKANKGIAFNSQIISLKVLDSTGKGKASNAVKAIEWAIKNKVDVLNLGFGGTISNCGEDILSKAVNKAAEKGILVIVAAGNPSVEGIMSPACAEKAIAVGSTTATAKNFPDLVASSQGEISGTSISSAYVSGTAALLLSAKPETNNQRLKEILFETADNINLPMEFQGFGRVNTFNAYVELVGLTVADLNIDLNTLNENFIESNKFEKLSEEEQKKLEKFLEKKEKEERKKKRISELPKVKESPDTLLYGVQRFLEEADLFLTFDKKIKAEKRLSQANLRLSELIEINKKQKASFNKQLLKDFKENFEEALTIAEEFPEIQENIAEQAVENIELIESMELDEEINETSEKALNAVDGFAETKPEKAAELYFRLSERMLEKLEEKENKELDELVEDYEKTIAKTQKAVEKAKDKEKNVEKLEQKIERRAEENIKKFTERHEKFSEKTKRQAEKIIEISVEILKANNKEIEISKENFGVLSKFLKEKILEIQTLDEISEINEEIKEEIEKTREEVRKEEFNELDMQIQEQKKIVEEQEQSDSISGEDQEDDDDNGTEGWGGDSGGHGDDSDDDSNGSDGDDGDSNGDNGDSDNGDDGYGDNGDDGDDNGDDDGHGGH